MASTIAGSDGPSHSLTSVPYRGETARFRRHQPDFVNDVADQAILVTGAAGFIGFHVAEHLL
jgi:hypothetical protein